MAQLKNLPSITRNPYLLLDMAEELRARAEDVERWAADQNRVSRERNRVLKIRAFALELERNAEAKLGTHVAAINNGH